MMEYNGNGKNNNSDGNDTGNSDGDDKMLPRYDHCEGNGPGGDEAACNGEEARMKCNGKNVDYDGNDAGNDAGDDNMVPRYEALVMMNLMEGE